MYYRAGVQLLPKGHDDPESSRVSACASPGPDAYTFVGASAMERFRPHEMLQIDEVRPPAASQRLGSAFLGSRCSLSARPCLLSGQTPTMPNVTGFAIVPISDHSISHFLPFFWCRMRESNPRPSVYKTAALPLC